MDPKDSVSVRFACLQEAIGFSRNSGDDEAEIVRAADVFYKFVNDGEVPKDEDA